MITLLAVTSDPGAWIVFAALVGACVGFFGCAIFASRRIRHIERTVWQEGYDRCNRDHEYKLKP